MPQFDKVIFFNQIFWLITAFLTFYFLVLKGLLPMVAISLKTRKKLVTAGFMLFPTNTETFGRKLYSKKLQSFLKTYRTLFFSISQKKTSFLKTSKLQILSSNLFSF